MPTRPARRRRARRARMPARQTTTSSMPRSSTRADAMSDQQAGDDERGSEVDDYTGEVPRPHAPDAAGEPDASSSDSGSGLGDGDVADVDADVETSPDTDDDLASSIFD